MCQWLDSNCGPLVLEATVLPTESQPLPANLIVHCVIQYITIYIVQIALLWRNVTWFKTYSAHGKDYLTNFNKKTAEKSRRYT